jgi:mono/diheme cytochrome c family protein
MNRALLFVFFLVGGSSASRAQEPEAPVDFYGQVKPLFAIHCVKCHGAEKPKSGLALDRRENLLKGGESGEAAVVPGKSSASALVRRITSDDPDQRMPPKGERMPAEQVAILRRWIDEGAAWPAKDAYWAFQPPQRPVVPGVARNPIDAFIGAKLQSKGLTLSPEADRISLLRRLYADLVGLPPTPSEAELFLEDLALDAVERLVDRLLADPRHGERWARHWLDLVRYAESDGFENDRVRPHAWRYRDYVIRSFNEDKPYDRFVKEQIAGDELWPDDPDALVATGFARLSGWDEICKNEKQRWQDYLNDATDTTGSVFLGLTVGCSRCHDHKYDRITMADYYSLQSFFVAAKREGKPIPGGGARDPAETRKKLAEEETAMIPLRRERRRLWNEARGVVLRLKEGVLGPGEALAATDEEIKKLVELRHPKRLGELDKAIKEHDETAELYRPAAEVLVESGPAAPASHILLRGALGQDGPEVGPSFVASFANGGPAEVRPALDGRSTGRRTALAEWLGSPANPMTARAIVNRLWQHHFGRGIVATPSDFGRNGVPAIHRELLDWLACELVARGWSLKAMHRLMVTSAVYRQSSLFNESAAKIDVENRLLWRMNRQRLEGEALRDSILSVSGRLNPKGGGPGVYPKVSKEVLVDLPNNDKLSAWGVSSDEDGLRRSVYVAQRRALMLPLVESFDGAEMNHTCPKRAATTVAPQALALFNGEFSRGESGHFADRVAREAGDDRSKEVERAYRLALVRPPTEAERARALGFLDEQTLRRLQPAIGTGAGRVEPSTRKDAERMALVDFCHVLLNSNEFVYVD